MCLSCVCRENVTPFIILICRHLALCVLAMSWECRVYVTTVWCRVFAVCVVRMSHPSSSWFAGILLSVCLPCHENVVCMSRLCGVVCLPCVCRENFTPFIILICRHLALCVLAMSWECRVHVTTLWCRVFAVCVSWECHTLHHLDLQAPCSLCACHVMRMSCVCHDCVVSCVCRVCVVRMSDPSSSWFAGTLQKWVIQPCW